ncbi:MAG: hypothetical protein ACOWWO_00725 [Peptococcaceae bacterium]
MKLNFVKISPAQNLTVLITDYVDPACYPEIAKVVMSYEYLNAEQVGFIVPPQTSQACLRLEMSGGEFCGNGVLAAAALGLYKGICPEGGFLLESSGVNGPLVCQTRFKAKNILQIKAEMPAPSKMEKMELEAGDLKVTGCLVQLPGICHFVTDYWPSREGYEQMVATIQDKTAEKALGIIPYRKKGEGQYEILPYVYVRDTGSRVFEQACGTGSLALGIYLAGDLRNTGTLQVRQPGGIINVEIRDKNFISTDVFFTCEGTVLIDDHSLADCCFRYSP